MKERIFYRDFHFRCLAVEVSFLYKSVMESQAEPLSSQSESRFKPKLQIFLVLCKECNNLSPKI